MRAWQGVLLLEGEETNDGRIIVPGSTRWEEVMIPVRMRPTYANPGDQVAEPVPVGSVESIVRDGKYLRARGHVVNTVHPGVYAAAALMSRVEVDATVGESLHITGGVLRSVVLTLDMSFAVWPEARIEVL